MNNIFNLRLKLEGVNLVDFVDNMQKQGIPVHNLARPEHKSIEFDISSHNFTKIKSEIEKKYSYLIIKNSFFNIKNFIIKNVALVICFAICLMTFIFSSTMIWQIKIFGTEIVDNSEILNVLQQNKIRVGKSFYIETTEVEKLLLNAIDNIGQISVSKQGNALIVNVSEKVIEEEENMTQILSDYSGIITECNVIRGTALVKVGDYVNVGDVLVEPYVFNAKGEKIDIEPLAEIKACVYICESASIKKKQIVFERTGRKMKKADYFWRSRKIFSSNAKKHFEYYETKVYNQNISFLLPVKQTVFEYYETVPVERTLDLETEKKGLIERVKHLAYQKLGNADNIDESIKCEIISDELFVNCVISCEKIITN